MAHGTLHRMYKGKNAIQPVQYGRCQFSLMLLNLPILMNKEYKAHYVLQGIVGKLQYRGSAAQTCTCTDT